MSKPTRFIKAMQAETGWKLSGRALLGQRDGYWFIITQPDAFQPIVVTTAVTDADTGRFEAIKQILKTKRKIYKLARLDHSNNILTMVLNPYLRANTNKAHALELITDLVRIFTQFGIASGCSICGSDEPLETVQIGEMPATLCANCREEFRDDFAAIRDHNEVSGSYLTGIIGALLGGLIGAGLWLAVSYMGFYASIVGFAMAYLAQYGYRLFRGKIGRGMPVVILLSLIFGLFVANTVEIAIGLAQDPEVGISFWEALPIAPRAFFDSELFYVDKVWMNAGLGLLFALWGGWSTIRSLSREAKGETYQIKPI